MKKILVGLLLSLTLVGCGNVNVETLKEEMQNSELTKQEKREMLNEYIEGKQESNVDMVEKYIDGKIEKEEFDSYFLEQHEVCELYDDNLEWEDWTSDETVYYRLYGTYCKGITNRVGEPEEHYEFDLKRLENAFNVAKIAENEEEVLEYHLNRAKENAKK